MKLRRVAGVLLSLASLAVVPGAARGDEAAPPAPAVERPVREMNLFVKEWTWDPEALRVKKGSHVVLHIESLDGARSFVLKPYKLKVALPEGERVTVEFDADQEGKFQFLCGRPCGNGCAKLRGNLTVY
jgi:heme/copper-type cytochrome/quinol oxidase subunit 2